VTQTSRPPEALPIWSRSTAFPKAPAGFGWLDPKGIPHELASASELIERLADDRKAELVLVWTPAAERMILPEELDGAEKAVLQARLMRLKGDLTRSQGLMGGITLWMLTIGCFSLLAAWHLAAADRQWLKILWITMQKLMQSTPLGLSLLMFLIFGFIPWYQAKKRLTELQGGSQCIDASPTSLLRFETWLELQKAPLTKALAILMVLVALVQWLSGDSIQAAGLVKEAYRHGEWWRLFTAPMLHGHVVHLLMNVFALLYLGKRVEIFARWPHLLLVFVFSAMAGGILSVRLLDATSVGSSGGLMGYLGFLLVFESLHARLVPLSARRRLLAGLAMTVLIGLLGYRFIDNAAHAGGLLAGMLYALVVFPRSTSFNRPEVMMRDRVAGGLAALVLVGFAGVAVVRILAA